MRRCTTSSRAPNQITGRGVGYKLFVVGLIDSMATNEMQRVYRLLKQAREEGIIPWEWIGRDALHRTSRQAEEDRTDAAAIERALSFPAAEKKKDPRYKWFIANHGRHCWELDAMDPNDLRDCVEQAIIGLIEPVAWQRCEVVNKAEQESLQTVLERWGVAS